MLTFTGDGASILYACSIGYGDTTYWLFASVTSFNAASVPTFNTADCLPFQAFGQVYKLGPPGHKYD